MEERIIETSRALTPATSGLSNVYEGTGRSFEGYEVRTGPAVEAFDQSGGATQWLVVNTLERNAKVSAQQLVEDGLLRIVGK